MSLRFDGRVVVITGAAGALLAAYALAFADRGARVVVNDLGIRKDGTGEPLAVAIELAERIVSVGGDAIASTDDIGTLAGAGRLIDCALDHYGRLDVLINNAGIMRDRSFKKMDMHDFEEVIRINLTGCACVSRAAFPHMVAQEYGRILMVTSASGLYGVFGAASYAAAKMGVVGLMRALHMEGIRHNVQVNALAPVATSRLLGDFVAELGGAETLSPDYVVPLVLYLCAEDSRPAGQIFAAGGGYYSRAAMIEGRGWRAEQGAVPTPEEIAKRINAISDLSGGREFSHSLELVRHMLGGT